MSEKIVKRALALIFGVGIMTMGYIYFSYSYRPAIDETQLKTTIASSVSLYGSVVPQKSVDLEFENTGKITSILKNVGEFVKAGTVLAKQDSAISNIRLSQANAAISVAEANLESASSNLSMQKYKLKSLKNNDASSNDKKAQQALIDSTRANVEAQKALLESARSSAQEASLQLNKYSIIAPFDGIIIKKNSEVGDLANPNVPNSSVLTMIAGNDINALEIDAFASEQDVTNLKIGQSADATLDAFGADTHFAVKILAIDPTETIRNGVSVYKVTLLFDQKDERIKSGMNASVAMK